MMNFEILFSGLVGSILTLFGKQVFDKYSSPKLEICCDKSIPCLVTSPINWPHEAPGYPPGTYESKWLRVRVANNGRSTALGARVYISQVKHRASNGIETKLEDQDLIQLEWSLRAPDEPSKFDLQRGVSRFADVCYTINRPNIPKIFPVGVVMPFRLRDAWKPGEFSILIMVACDNAPPVEKLIKFSWDGPFDTLRIN